MAATMLGWDNLFHCEINPFGRAVLDYWYPNAKSYEDITTTDFSEWRGRVTVLTGGFPCQPFSYAGQRRGAQDDRYLWPYMFRCIDQVQPDWVVAENVAGITTMVEQGKVSPMAHQASLFDEDNGVQRYRLRETFTLERICQDLESHGYEVQPVLIPACAVGAPHRRDRVFIVARRVVADTDNRADRRGAGQDEGKGGEERIQERHEVRKPDEPNQVRREGEANVLNADTDRHDEGGLRASGTAEGERSKDNIQPREQSRRDGQTSRTADVHGILRTDANTKGECGQRMRPEQPETRGTEQVESGRRRSGEDGYWYASHTSNEGPQGNINKGKQASPGIDGRGRFNAPGCGGQAGEIAGCGRWAKFPTVSPVHSGNDGIPIRMDGASLSFGKWRTEALKAYGNAIVRQVMYEIFRAIEMTYQ